MKSIAQGVPGFGGREPLIRDRRRVPDGSCERRFTSIGQGFFQQ